MTKYAAALACLACWIALPSVATAKAKPSQVSHWVGTWASSPLPGDSRTTPPAPGLNDATLRQIVHVSAGGPRLRVRFSNAFGASPLTIVSAHIAMPAGGSAIQPATDHALSFHGDASVTIPAGALLVSDPVDFPLEPLSDLAITVFLKSVPEEITAHDASHETSYLRAGNVVSAPDMPSASKTEHWYFINGVDVEENRPAGAIVALGDSITDGAHSANNANSRWPDDLARRLASARGTSGIGVLNEGIDGNRLLHDDRGPNGLARFDRDVLAQTGVRWLILFEGVNDIGSAAHAAQLHEQPATAQDIIAAYQQIIWRAHAHGIKVYGATITPFGGSFYDSPTTEAERAAVNQWIRKSGQFDAVIDFDAAIRDTKNPTRMRPSAAFRDRLHPNDTGYRILGNAVDLRLFTGPQ